jgi:hypothetical protein
MGRRRVRSQVSQRDVAQAKKMFGVIDNAAGRAQNAAKSFRTTPQGREMWDYLQRILIMAGEGWGLCEELEDRT